MHNLLNMVVWQRMSDEPLPMMQGKFPELKKMSVKQKNTEIEAWRNLWSYTPSEVKYYLLKSGTQMALTMRNYKRHLGVLLSTRWDIKDIEIGVYEKEYDPTSGKYFFERKIIKLNPQSVIDTQWIQERIPEEEMTGQSSQPPAEEAETAEQADT